MRGTRRFEGILVAGHKGGAVEVPFDPAQVWRAEQTRLWPGRRGLPVSGRLNGIAFESAIVGRMRRFFVLVTDGTARQAGVTVGKAVEVVLWPTVPAQRERSSLGKRPAPGSQREKREERSKPSRAPASRRPTK